jgi:lysozyme family protein
MRYADIWPIYAKDWDAMVINPSSLILFQSEAQYAVSNKATYLQVGTATGLPWPMIAVIHRRESNADFHSYLGNGQLLDQVTTEVPAKRGPFCTQADFAIAKNLMAAFVHGAIDAVCQEGWGSVNNWRLEKILYYCELFNGPGYYLHHIPSPYIWGLTNVQKPGKYIRDSVFNPSVMDTQPGCAPLLQQIAKLDPSVVFVRES